MQSLNVYDWNKLLFAAYEEMTNSNHSTLYGYDSN